MQELSPYLEILPAAQRLLWVELSAVPDEFTLYGGTALALHLGHRNSVDFDFFGSRTIDLETLENEIPFLAGAEIIQREKNTLSAIVDRGAPVKVSFFGVPKLPRLAPSPHRQGQRLEGCLSARPSRTKASVLQVRAEAKGLHRYGCTDARRQNRLTTGIGGGGKALWTFLQSRNYAQALSYFDDGNLRELSEEVRIRLAAAVQEVDLDHLPTIDGSKRMDRDHGYSL